MGASYIKTLNEVWDPYQLRTVQIGGNKALYEFLRDYGRERDEIDKKYKSDPARFYARSLSFRVKNLPYMEKAPPKNATEHAQRAADVTSQYASSAYASTSKAASEFDEKYKVSEKASQGWTSLKTSVGGLFAKKDGPAQGSEWAHKSDSVSHGLRSCEWISVCLVKES